MSFTDYERLTYNALKNAQFAATTCEFAHKEFFRDEADKSAMKRAEQALRKAIVLIEEVRNRDRYRKAVDTYRKAPGLPLPLEGGDE